MALRCCQTGEGRMSFVLGMIIGLALSLALLCLAVALAAMIWGDDAKEE